MEQGGLSTGIEYPFVSHVLLPGYQEDRTARTYYSLETLWKKVREKQWRLLYSLNDSHMQDPGGRGSCLPGSGREQLLGALPVRPSTADQ